MNIAWIHCFWNSFVKNNLWKKKKKKKEKESTNSRGLKIRSEDWRGGKRRDTREMPAHDRPYSPVKGLITIVKPVRRSARVGEQMRALNRRYLGTAIMCRVRLQDGPTFSHARTLTHHRLPTVLVVVVVIVIVVRRICIRDASIDRQYNDSQGSNEGLDKRIAATKKNRDAVYK